jgi:hypothetical protein
MAFSLDLVTFRPKRKIGEFTAYVAFEEAHTDDLTITAHPVEQGAQITDHAIKEPAVVVIRAGWSQSSLSGLIGAAKSILSGGGFGGLLGNDYARETYDKLLKLQADRQPIEVVTGKRKYKNMLMRSLAMTTDRTTENVLVVTATFREIIMVETQSTTLPPKENQAEPQKTAPPQSTGAKQLAPAPTANQSALSALSDLKKLKAQAEAGG